MIASVANGRSTRMLERMARRPPKQKAARRKARMMRHLRSTVMQSTDIAHGICKLCSRRTYLYLPARLCERDVAAMGFIQWLASGEWFLTEEQAEQRRRVLEMIQQLEDEWDLDTDAEMAMAADDPEFRTEVPTDPHSLADLSDERQGEVA